MCSGGIQGSSASLSRSRHFTPHKPFRNQTSQEKGDSVLSSTHPRMHKQDPMSHRIIEKRRRDRMNNCLADLSRLIPTTYLKKGRGRVEKTEIIEMAIKHLKHLQAHPCNDPPNCEVAKSTEQEKLRHFRLGFHESMSESVRFLVEIEGFYAGNGACCIRLVNHLQKHFDKLISGSAVTQKYSDLDFREETMAETMDVESVWNVVVPPESMRTFDPQQNGMTECHEWIDDEKAENCEKPLVLKSSNNDDPTAQVTTGSSQLRQMLQSPVVPIERIRSSSTGENNPNRFSSVSRPSSTSSCIAQCQFSATHKVEEVYKFKNNIKERFKADSSYFSDPSILCDESNKNHALETKGVLSTDTFTPVGQELEASSNLQHSVSTYRCEISGKPCENLTMTDSGVASSSWDMVETSRTFFTNCGSSNHRQSSGSSSGYSTGTETSVNRRYRGEQSPTYYSESPENFSSSSSISPTSQPCSTGIPIFALHPKGTFYIPLTMDATLVAPYVDTFDENQRSLHPISISVNFCNPGRTVEKLPRDTCEQSDFFGCERYSKQCGSPDINPVSIPYTITARN